MAHDQHAKPMHRREFLHTIGTGTVLIATSTSLMEALSNAAGATPASIAASRPKPPPKPKPRIYIGDDNRIYGLRNGEPVQNLIYYQDKNYNFDHEGVRDSAGLTRRITTTNFKDLTQPNSKSFFLSYDKQGRITYIVTNDNDGKNHAMSISYPDANTAVIEVYQDPFDWVAGSTIKLNGGAIIYTPHTGPNKTNSIPDPTSSGASTQSVGHGYTTQAVIDPKLALQQIRDTIHEISQESAPLMGLVKGIATGAIAGAAVFGLGLGTATALAIFGFVSATMAFLNVVEAHADDLFTLAPGEEMGTTTELLGLNKAGPFYGFWIGTIAFENTTKMNFYADDNGIASGNIATRVNYVRLEGKIKDTGSLSLRAYEGDQGLLTANMHIDDKGAMVGNGNWHGDIDRLDTPVSIHLEHENFDY
jgi:hypothetical protein